MNKKLLDIYTDYLITSNNSVTSTGLAEISNNQITRFLSNEKFDSVTSVVRKVESEDDGCLIFDETIEEKPYTDENDISIPVAFEVVVKDVLFCDLISGKEKRVSSVGIAAKRT